jgi:hypothetical protein
MTRLVVRHVTLTVLPSVIGVAAGMVFAGRQPTCGALVGPLFAAKCGRMLVQYQLWIQTGVTLGLAVLATMMGIWLERRRLKRAALATIPPPPPAAA